MPSRKCLVPKQCLQLLHHTHEVGPGKRVCQKLRGYSGYYQCLHTCLDVNDAILELPNQRFKSSEQHKGKHTVRIVRDTIDVETFAAFLKCRNRFTNSPHLRNTETGVVAEGSVNAVRSIELFILGDKENTFKRSFKAVTLATRNAVKIGENEVYVDSQLLFQRLLAVSDISLDSPLEVSK